MAIRRSGGPRSPRHLRVRRATRRHGQSSSCFGEVPPTRSSTVPRVVGFPCCRVSTPRALFPLSLLTRRSCALHMPNRVLLRDQYCQQRRRLRVGYLLGLPDVMSQLPGLPKRCLLECRRKHRLLVSPPPHGYHTSSLPLSVTIPNQEHAPHSSGHPHRHSPSFAVWQPLPSFT